MPGKLIGLRELKERILKYNNVLIISHINPDPDTLGSGLGLKWIFEKLDKSAGIICDTEINEKICGYLNVEPELDNIKPEDIKNFDYLIAVDAAAVVMLGKSLEKYKNNIDLVIDHHYTNSLYGKETYLEKVPATGEIIYNLAKLFKLEIDRDFAKNIYCAIAGDSGSFRFSSTTPETMRIGAELIETGFDFAKLNRLMFENKSLEQIAAEKLAYNNLKLYNNGKTAVINLTNEIKKEAGLENCQFDGINPRNIMGVEVGVIIIEKDPREFKISLRSNEYANVAEIAGQLNGGGHIHAAGCNFKAGPELENPAEYIEKMLIEKIESVL